jgi:WhiB family redox-sensing transcriptional regulator
MWMDRGACSDHDTDLWLASDHGPTANARIAEAVLVCRSCPVRTECLEFALARSGRCENGTGVWGGLTPPERRTIRRHRRDKGAA